MDNSGNTILSQLKINDKSVSIFSVRTTVNCRNARSKCLSKYVHTYFYPIIFELDFTPKMSGSSPKPWAHEVNIYDYTTFNYLVVGKFKILSHLDTSSSLAFVTG